MAKKEIFKNDSNIGWIAWMAVTLHTHKSSPCYLKKSTHARFLRKRCKCETCSATHQCSLARHFIHSPGGLQIHARAKI